ncbi:MAG: Ycf66 family protein [Xenococcaceae cyanobacterium]
MVNFGLNAASLLGIFLAVAGASLYFMRSVRPELSRDHDIFFAAVGLLCGFILLFQGWRLDPILQFSQLLLSGSAVFFAVESIRLRKVATEQARRNTPTVDKERPVSRTRVYTEAELDRIEADEYPSSVRVNYNSPRLRGYEEPKPRPSRRASNIDKEARSYRTRPRPEQSGYRDDFEREDSRSRRRPSYSSRRDRDLERRESNNRYDEWQQEDRWNEPEYPSRSGYTEERYDRNDYQSPPNRQPISPRDMGRSYDDTAETSSSDYVDYQPLDNLGRDYQDNNDWERDNNSPPEQPSRSDDDRGRNPINFDY